MLDPAYGPPPSFADARALIADAFAELRFPAKVLVSEAARLDRILINPGAYSGPWGDSPHDMRFADRAMDGLHADSPYDEVVIEGPSQTGKSEVGNNWMLHTILYDQADMLFVLTDKESLKSYVTTQIVPMLDAQPKLRARQLGGASSDNINLKQFRGCDIHMLHPVSTTFRARPISRGRLDDYDDFPTDINNQGDGISLLKGRMGSFDMFGRTKIYVNSTPRLGDRAGIAARRAGGTDERWWIDCLQCGEPFELDCEQRLDFDRTEMPEDAASSARVVCPECGYPHRQTEKRAMMATGRWIGRGERAVSGGKEGELIVSKRLSQRWDGLMGMRSWANIAHQWRAAELTFDMEQDEGPLKAVYQTVIGKNYVPRGSGEPPATEDAIRRRALASLHRLGTVPADAVCLIATVDQQANRFEVAVWAFGPGFRVWLVDRFEILTIERDGRDQRLKPFTRPEDWAVLHAKVLSLTYPMADGRAGRMKILNTAVDTGGLDNATDNAFQWWHAMVAGDVGSGRTPVPPTAITLVKGGNKPGAKLLPPPTIDAKRQLKGAPQAGLYVPNVNRLKDIADTRLKIEDGGAGSIHFPGDVDRRGELLAAKWIAEMRAETKVGDQWTRDPHRANETWDLYLYAYTVVLRLGGGDASLSWVPEWARPPKGAPRKLPKPAPDAVTPAENESVREPVAAARASHQRPARRAGPKRNVRVQRAR